MFRRPNLSPKYPTIITILSFVMFIVGMLDDGTNKLIVRPSSILSPRL